MLNPEEEKGPDSQPLEQTPVETVENTPLQTEEQASTPTEEIPAPPPPSKLKSRAMTMGYDGEDYEDFMDNYVSDLEGFKKRSEEVNSALWDAIEADPSLKETLKITAIDGKPFLVAIHSVFTPEELQALPDDPMYAEVQDAIGTRKSKLEESRKRKQDMETNAQLSQQAITEFASENGLTEEQAADFLGKVDAALSDIFSGKITKDFLMSMKKALNYENDIASASEMAEIKGRNANIEANIIDKPISDGLPKVQGGGSVAQTMPERKKTRTEILAETERDRYKS